MKLDELKRREEAKREAAWDPVKRWRIIQETIAWAEANRPEHLRRNRPRQPFQWGGNSAPECDRSQSQQLTNG